jgi:hypothetical protein
MVLVTKTLHELEQTIPGQQERMTVRMIRMIIENGLAEVESAMSHDDQWAVSIEIFVMMRSFFSVLSLANPGTDSARLCSVIRDGMSIMNADGSLPTAREIIDHNVTVTDRFGFVICVYQRVSDELTDLTRDDGFMKCMGSEGEVKFAEITSLMNLMVDIGKKIVDDILEQQNESDVNDMVMIS